MMTVEIAVGTQKSKITPKTGSLKLCYWLASEGGYSMIGDVFLKPPRRGYAALGTLLLTFSIMYFLLQQP